MKSCVQWHWCRSVVQAFLPLIIQASLKNSIAPMSCSKAAIVNVSSISGSCAKYPGDGFLAYRMSKVINVSCCIHNKLRFGCYDLLVLRKASCDVFMGVLGVQNGVSFVVLSPRQHWTCPPWFKQLINACMEWWALHYILARFGQN